MSVTGKPLHQATAYIETSTQKDLRDYLAKHATAPLEERKQFIDDILREGENNKAKKLAASITCCPKTVQFFFENGLKEEKDRLIARANNWHIAKKDCSDKQLLEDLSEYLKRSNDGEL